MRRYPIYLLLALGSLFVSVVAWAQDSSTNGQSQNNPIIVAIPPPQMLADSRRQISIPVEASSPHFANSAGDSCAAAAEISLSNNSFGDEFNVYSLSEEPSTEPALNCMWGSPAEDEGFRTAWYKFMAPYNGRVLINTLDSSYDTVLALFQLNDAANVCDFEKGVPEGSKNYYMQNVGCNDDNVGFTSRLSATVKKDVVYYIEVADWSAAGTDKLLRISVLMEPIDTLWSQESPMPLPRSRHATAVVGDDIYVIGGQTNLSAPTLTNSFERYETDTGQWVTLPNMPGPGYSNTTAVYVDGDNDTGRIYLPSGFDGSYNITHWAYDVQGSYWLTRTAVTDFFPATIPFAWASAVVVDSPPGYYLTGGLNTVDSPDSPDDVSAKTFFFNPIPTHGIWQSETDMSVARYAHTAAMVDGELCVVGGLRYDAVDGLVLLSNGECYGGGGPWHVGKIPDMNYARYGAGSAVGPDGKWYVFGGQDGDHNAVSETEVYDPAVGTWTVLDVNHDLGGSETLQARGWPRGGVVDSTLWAIGGNNAAQQPLSLVESLFLPTDYLLLPVIFSDYGEDTRLDDHFSVAHRLTINAPQYRDFDTLIDYYDVYYFDLSALTAVNVKLTQVPSNSDYNIGIYDANKLLWGEGTNLQGLNESVPLTLSAGRYYVVVERIWPTGDPNTADYRIIVEE
ncbi:MAG: hypothetical protein GY803_00790 [Chloroflexi bacterium]|nr:hypothetical protein [Chloroflexota bacterium]